VCVRVCARARMCACVHMRARVHVCLLVDNVCERERECVCERDECVREKKRERKRGGKRVEVYLCV